MTTKQRNDEQRHLVGRLLAAVWLLHTPGRKRGQAEIGADKKRFLQRREVVFQSHVVRAGVANYERTQCVAQISHKDCERPSSMYRCSCWYKFSAVAAHTVRACVSRKSGKKFRKICDGHALMNASTARTLRNAAGDSQSNWARVSRTNETIRRAAASRVRGAPRGTPTTSNHRAALNGSRQHI